RRLAQPGRLHHADGLGAGSGRGRHLPGCAPLECDAQVQPAEPERRQAGDDDDGGDGEPPLLPTDEVEGGLAVVQAAQRPRPPLGLGRRLHLLPLLLVGEQLVLQLLADLLVAQRVEVAVAVAVPGGTVPGGRVVGEQRLLLGGPLPGAAHLHVLEPVVVLVEAHRSAPAPAPTAKPRSMPIRLAWVSRSLRPRRTTSGRVKKYVMKMSNRVDSPRKKAKPFTVPTATK